MPGVPLVSCRMSFAPNPRRRPHASRPALGLYPMELSRNLKVDSISRLEPTEPRAIDAGQTVAEAVTVMREENVGCLLITESNRVVGLFTERDLLTRVLEPGKPLDTPIRLCMTANPVTVSPKDSVRTAVKRMQKGGYRHLPVVDEAGRPVGILSARRVVHYVVEHFPSLVFNLPPQPDQYPKTPDGA
jgi:CBS domain-containing protein